MSHHPTHLGVVTSTHPCFGLHFGHEASGIMVIQARSLWHHSGRHRASEQTHCSTRSCFARHFLISLIHFLFIALCFRLCGRGDVRGGIIWRRLGVGWVVNSRKSLPSGETQLITTSRQYGCIRLRHGIHSGGYEWLAASGEVSYTFHSCMALHRGEGEDMVVLGMRVTCRKEGAFACVSQ